VDLNALPPATGSGEIMVITGWRDVGKTSYCQRAVEAYRAAGRTVSGLLSPGRFEQCLDRLDNRKTGFFAHDLRSGERRLVASAVPGELNGIQLGPWTFDAQVFEWGNRCLQQADGADVLFIDELGPLEFNRQTGWVASFDLLRRKNYRLALVVIRPELLGAFSSLGFAFQTKEIDVSQASNP
jgi:nucleoside-triphosphatase THEP1